MNNGRRDFIKKKIENRDIAIKQAIDQYKEEHPNFNRSFKECKKWITKEERKELDI